MTQQHPIVPPPELVKQWIKEFSQPNDPRWQEYEQDIATCAAQWGADTELEACCEWIADWYGNGCNEVIGHLRSARRPKPPSLKEQALIEFDSLLGDSEHEGAAIIRHALEQLPDPS